MKKFFTLLAMVAATLMLTPTNAEARDRHHNHRSYTYCSGHTSCGCPIYTKRVVRYYDCYGRPVYAYYRQPVSHKCRHYNHGHRHHKHYSHSHNHRSHSGYHRSHTRVSYSGPYGRVVLTR